MADMLNLRPDEMAYLEENDPQLRQRLVNRQRKKQKKAEKAKGQQGSSLPGDGLAVPHDTDMTSEQ